MGLNNQFPNLRGPHIHVKGALLFGGFLVIAVVMMWLVLGDS